MRIFNTGISTGIMELNGMEFHAFHGCLEQEKREGNLFVVDFKAELDIDGAMKSDDLKDTVDVNAIYAIIKEEMNHRCNLLETVASNICKHIVKDFEDYLLLVEVRVSKHNPPLDGKCEWSRITARWEA